jgi:hypothetical protein
MIYFKIWNCKARDFVRDDKDEIFEFDLITWAYYASMNRLENMDGLTIKEYLFRD